MGVHPGDAEGEFVDGGLSDEFGAGVDQGLDGGGGGFGLAVGAQPFGAAGPGDEPGDVEQVFGAEGQPGEWALGRTGDVYLGMTAEGAKVVVHGQGRILKRRLVDGWWWDSRRAGSGSAGR